jgi:hypothetical protein
VVALGTGLILHRTLRGPKIQTVSRPGEEPFQAFRMRTVGIVVGPVMFGHNNDLISLRLYADHLDIGATPRRSYPYSAVEKIEYSTTLFGNSLRLHIKDGVAWALMFYDAAQLQAFLDAVRGRVPDGAVPVASIGGAGPSVPPTQGWLKRNWKWAVPVGLLGAFLLNRGLLLLLMAGALVAVRWSAVFELAMTRVRSNAVSMEALGTPINAGFVVSGSIGWNAPPGTADVTIPVSGPRGAGTLHVVGRESAGKWTLTTLQLALTGSGRRIDLVAPPGG